MVKRKISISFAADDKLAFMIETMIRSDVVRIIQDNGGKSMKMQMESLPVENKSFEIR